MAFDRLPITLLALGEIWKQQAVKNLVTQGHVASRELLEGIQVRIEMRTDSIVLIEDHPQHGLFLDADPARRKGAKGVPISALEDWIRLKGFETDAKKVRGMAFAIQKTIIKEGSPTKASKAMGKKSGWLTDALDVLADDFAQKIEDVLDEEINIIIDNVLRSVKTQFVTVSTAA